MKILSHKVFVRVRIFMVNGLWAWQTVHACDRSLGVCSAHDSTVMSLLNYFKRADGGLLPRPTDPLSIVMPSIAIASANKIA